MPVSLSNVADSHVPSLGGFLEGWSITQAIAAEPNYRNLLLGTSERLTRDRIGAGVGQLNLGRSFLGLGQRLRQGHACAQQAGTLQKTASVEAVPD